MKKLLSICLGFALTSFTFAGTSLADTTQNLSPGDAGYVGALNNRPSNAFTPSNSSTMQPMTVGYWYQHEPGTIAVLVRPNNDPTASGTVYTYNFGTYLDDVLPNEWVASWPSAALRAGAVSVRSYGWYCCNYPKYPNVGAALDNTTNSQVFKLGTATSPTNSAISGTAGEAVIYGSEEEPGFYKAGSYGPGRDSSSYSFYNNAYQNGEDYYANLGDSYTWMLSYYYPSTSIVTGNGY